MKLSISNIAWEEKDDESVYALMRRYGFTGLEIAPTRIFPVNPYEDVERAKRWADDLKEAYGFSVPSMQSIWYGRQERLFASEDERDVLLEYTKQAVDFAAAAGCKNLVFGCPKNRNMPDGADENVAVEFFRAVGGYAVSKGTAIGLEANPPMYGTNFINDTAAALDMIQKVGSPGFLLNLDTGTMIANGENLAVLEGNVHLVNHIHISEPHLKPIQRRTLHRELMGLLDDEGYHGYVSIEMGKTERLREIEDAMGYVREVWLQ